MTAAATIAEIVNTDEYRIDDQSWLRDSKQIKSMAAKFRADGLLTLPNFIRPAALAEMVQAAEDWATNAYFKRVEGNPYLEVREQDKELGADHPRNQEDWTRLGVIAYDQIAESALIRKVYQSAQVRQFVENLYGHGQLYNYNCPLGALNISVMESGDYLRWHFDLSDFVVSIPLQDAEVGGIFEFAHNVRSKDNENYQNVSRVLDGTYNEIRTLDTAVGSLILFQGRYTLHRVSPIAGTRLRLGALLGYVDDPKKGGSDHLRMMRYGRTK